MDHLGPILKFKRYSILGRSYYVPYCNLNLGTNKPHMTVLGLAIVYMVCSNTERGDIQPHDIIITRTKDDSPPPHNVK